MIIPFCIVFSFNYIIVIQQIKMDQVPKVKIYFLLFPKWLLFQPNFDAKWFEIRHCIIEIWWFYWWCHKRSVKNLIMLKKKRKYKRKKVYKISKYVLWSSGISLNSGKMSYVRLPTDCPRSHHICTLYFLH